jgi:hypothetical protein
MRMSHIKYQKNLRDEANALLGSHLLDTEL